MFEEGRTYLSGPHLRMDCPDCGAYVKFLPKSIDEFKMPIGKYKGKTFAEIEQTDKQYVVWVSNNIQGRPGKAASEYLKRG